MEKDNYKQQKVNKNKTWTMKKCILFFAIAVLFALTASRIVHFHQLQQQVADKVIRFHVLANSDSSKDQALKLAVRDCVGTYLGEQLKEAQTLADGKAILAANLEEVEAQAAKEIARWGYDYPVTASLETCYFPLKAYGNAVFPPGNYQALRVVIGEGEGKNWWCVLYPNLCFSGNLYRIDENASTEKLKTMLSPEEYKLIMENKEYEIGFRIQEVFSELLAR